MKTVIGGESENIIKGLTFNDEQAIAQLNKLKNKYPDNLIVINGELTLDLPDKLKHKSLQEYFLCKLFTLMFS